jgi:hypothetical protein
VFMNVGLANCPIQPDYNSRRRKSAPNSAAIDDGHT